MNRIEEAASTFMRALAESLLLGDYKMRKEVEMDIKRKTLKEYIKHLRKAQVETEEKQDLIMGDTPKLDERFVTLGIIIKDLEKIDTQEFSYWDV